MIFKRKTVAESVKDHMVKPRHDDIKKQYKEKFNTDGSKKVESSNPSHPEKESGKESESDKDIEKFLNKTSEEQELVIMAMIQSFGPKLGDINPLGMLPNIYKSVRQGGLTEDQHQKIYTALKKILDELPETEYDRRRENIEALIREVDVKWKEALEEREQNKGFSQKTEKEQKDMLLEEIEKTEEDMGIGNMITVSRCIKEIDLTENQRISIHASLQNIRNALSKGDTRYAESSADKLESEWFDVYTRIKEAERSVKEKEKGFSQKTEKEQKDMLLEEIEKTEEDMGIGNMITVSRCIKEIDLTENQRISIHASLQNIRNALSKGDTRYAESSADKLESEWFDVYTRIKEAERSVREKEKGFSQKTEEEQKTALLEEIEKTEEDMGIGNMITVSRCIKEIDLTENQRISIHASLQNIRNALSKGDTRYAESSADKLESEWFDVYTRIKEAERSVKEKEKGFSQKTEEEQKTALLEEIENIEEKLGIGSLLYEVSKHIKETNLTENQRISIHASLQNIRNALSKGATKYAENSADKLNEEWIKIKEEHRITERAESEKKLGKNKSEVIAITTYFAQQLGEDWNNLFPVLKNSENLTEDQYAKLLPHLKKMSSLARPDKQSRDNIREAIGAFNRNFTNILEEGEKETLSDKQENTAEQEKENSIDVESEDLKTIRKYIEDPNASVDLLASVAEKVSDKSTLTMVAEHPNASADTLVKIVEKNKGFSAIRAALIHPNMPVDILKKRARVSKDAMILRVIAQNPNTPMDIVRKFWKDAKRMQENNQEKDSLHIRAGLAGNPNLPVDIFKGLAKDKETSIRMLVYQ